MRGIMSLEEFNEEPEVEVVENTDFSEAAETPMLEMAEAQAEVDQIVGDIDRGADTADTLDAMGEKVEKAIQEEGGLSEAGAAAVEVAVEALRLSVGFKPAKAYALESFGDKATRLQATKVALEDIKESARKIWAKIVAAFKAAIDYVMKFVEKVLDASKRLKARAAALAAAAGKLGDKKAEGELDVTAAAKKLHVNGKMEDASGLAKAIKAIGGIAELATSDIQKFNESVTTKSAKGEDAGGVFEPQYSENVLPENYSVPEGYKVLSKELPLGGQSYFLLYPTANTTKVQKFKAFVRMKSFLAQAKGSAKAPTDVKMKAFDAAGIKEVCSAVQAAMDEIAAKKKDIDALKKDYADVTKKAKEAGVKPEETSAAKATLSISVSLATVMRSYKIQVGKSALDLCNASLKAHK